MKAQALKIILFLLIMNVSLAFKGQVRSSIHNLSASSISGENISLKDFSGKKILIVNTASKCGFTPQLKQLQALHEKYKELVIIGFPSNDFANQDPGSNQEIESFCTKNYGVSFLMMEKIHVKGDSMHPIYQWLTQKKENGVKNSKVLWNFQKYLINEKGELVTKVASWRKPNCRKVRRWLKKNQSSK